MAYSLGFIGDSITLASYPEYSGPTPPQACASAVQEATGITSSSTNRGSSGSTSGNWHPSTGTGILGDAKTAFASASVTDVFIMLGANDCNASVSAATYGSNLSAISSNLVTAGYRVWLNYPSYCSWDDGLPGSPYLVAYQAEIDSLVNGSTIRQGDVEAYDYFLANQGEMLDGVHLLSAGGAHLGEFWAAPLIALLGAATVRPRWKGGRYRRI